MSQNYGIQEDGEFERKFVGDIQSSLEKRAEAMFGENIDLSPGSPHQQLIDIASLELAHLWESLEGVYYASYFKDAYGVQIDRILSLAGVSRIPRRGATGEVKFTTNSPNDSDVTIPAGTRVSTDSTETTPSIPFRTTDSATLTAGDTEVTQVPIRALEPWEASVDAESLGTETNISSDSITNIDDPISGIDAVTNPYPTGGTGTRDDGSSYDFVTGRDRETDSELKNRYRDSLSLGGSATLGSIEAAVYNTEGVDSSDIEENTSNTDNTDSGGLPPKSFRVTVLTNGANPDDIAQSILETRSAGIQSYGNFSGTATLEGGEEYSEYYDEADDTQIYIDASLDVTDTFPADGDEQVKENILHYIGGIKNDGTSVSGLSIGNDVLYDMVFSAAMNVQGVRRADVKIGTSSSPSGTSDISIANGNVARTHDNNFTVSHTTI